MQIFARVVISILVKRLKVSRKLKLEVLRQWSHIHEVYVSEFLKFLRDSLPENKLSRMKVHFFHSVEFILYKDHITWQTP